MRHHLDGRPALSEATGDYDHALGSYSNLDERIS